MKVFICIARYRHVLIIEPSFDLKRLFPYQQTYRTRGCQLFNDNREDRNVELRHCDHDLKHTSRVGHEKHEVGIPKELISGELGDHRLVWIVHCEYEHGLTQFRDDHLNTVHYGDHAQE